MKDTKQDRSRRAQAAYSPGQILTLSTLGTDDEGYGTALVGDLPVAIFGALAGETVRARIVFAGKRRLVADLVSVINPSPLRVSPSPCDKAATCCGCPLIAMDYQAQLQWKKVFVSSSIHRLASLSSLPVHDVVASPSPFRYRTSAKLVIAGKFSNPTIGIYRRNSHNVVDIASCTLHHPLINRIIETVRTGIQKGKVPIYSPRTGNGLLRYLVIRISRSEDRAMVAFVTNERSYNEILHLGRFLQREVPEVSVIVQNVNASQGNVIMGEEDYFLTQNRFLVDRLDSVKFAISPRSFFQVNTESAALIYRKVRDWAELKGDESVLDLYCGIGGISLFLAGKAHFVLGIEVIEEAVVDADRNARLNGIRNCRFESGDARELLEGMYREGTRFDLVVLNPPRKGCDIKVLEIVARMVPRKIIYVSCSPQSLARDLDVLAGYGCIPREIQPVDMFPQTTHIESVALLDGPAPRQNERKGEFV